MMGDQAPESRMSNPITDRTLVAGHWTQFRDTVLAQVTPPLDSEQLRLAEYVYRFAAHGTANMIDELFQRGTDGDMRRVLASLVAEANEYFATRPKIRH